MGTTINENFRRRVQQRVVDRYAENAIDNEKSVDVNEKSEGHKKSTKASPYSFQNLIWLFAAVAVFFFSDVPSVILYDWRIKRSWFWVGVVAFGLHVSIATFLVLWLSIWKKVDSNNWESMYPKAVPIATAAFIIGSFCLLVSLWPVWGFFTPLILGSQLMGIIILIAFVG